MDGMAFSAFKAFVFVWGIPIIGVILAVIEKQLKDIPTDYEGYKKLRVAGKILWVLLIMSVIFNAVDYMYTMSHFADHL